MPQYRVEISNSARAGCQAPHCKDTLAKIPKGVLRQAVEVKFNGEQSWKYRHWGCVTPEIIKKWQDECDMDFNIVDGLDGLPDELQEKVKRAIAQGHVDDDDWNGDVECNRYTGKKTKPMFVGGDHQTKEPKDGSNDGSKETKSKAKSNKKRKAALDDENVEDQKPAPKKARAKKATKQVVTDDSDESATPPPKKRGRKSKQADADEDEASPQPVVKRKKAKSSKKVKVEDEDDNEPEDEEPAKKGKATAKKAAPKAKPQRRSKKATDEVD